MNPLAKPLAVAALLLSAFGRVAAPAEEGAVSDWKALAPGLWYRAWTIQRAIEGSGAAAGHVFRADPRIVRLTVLDARRGERSVARASTLRAEARAFLVVNGGFFDENGRALGLAVGEGHEHTRLRQVDQGVFLISAGKPSIQHTRDTLPSPIETALQAGPRLVVEGRALHLKPQVSRRTAVCLPGDGTVMIVVFPTPVSLSDLAENLVRPVASGGLSCWSALNLDGGPSTQLSLASEELSLEIEGGWGVPNALAILPK